jgi:hypothetical protein
LETGAAEDHHGSAQIELKKKKIANRTPEKNLWLTTIMAGRK